MNQRFNSFAAAHVRLALALLIGAAVSPARADVTPVFGNPVNVPVLSTAAPPVSLATGDFNGDGIADLVGMGAPSFTPSQGLVLLGRGDTTFASKVISDGYSSNAPHLLVGDFNNDGNADFGMTTDVGGHINLHLGQGDGTVKVVPEDHYILPYGNTMNSWLPYPSDTADFNGDGRPDIVVGGAATDGYQTQNLTVLLSQIDGTFLPVNSEVPAVPQALVSGDFNGDGKADVAIAINPVLPSYIDHPRADYQVDVLLGQGDGTFSSPGQIVFHRDSGVISGLAAGDVNGDGKVDLVVAQTLPSNANVLSIFPGNGNGSFETNQDIPFRVMSLPTWLKLADVNSDQKLDLIASVGSWVTVFPNKGNGQFDDPQDYAISTPQGRPASFALCDFNGDGWIDLAAAAGGGLSLFLNQTAPHLTLQADASAIKPGDTLHLTVHTDRPLASNPLINVSGSCVDFSTFYSTAIGDGSYTGTYTAPSPITDCGLTFTARSQDAEGHTTHTILHALLDRTAPSTQSSVSGTAASDGGFNSIVSVQLTATDLTSGVAQTFYAVDDSSCSPDSTGSCKTYTGSFGVGSTGDHTVYYFSKDEAGNFEPQQTRSFHIDGWTPLNGLTPVDPGTIITVAGGGVPSDGVGDGGPATQAALHRLFDIDVDGQNNLYIADLVVNRIRKMTPNGIISTVAGTGVSGNFGVGGPATAAGLGFPYGVSADSHGNFFIADQNQRVVKVDPQGILTLYAGGNQFTGFNDTGDGGPATEATVPLPMKMDLDSLDNLYIVESLNSRLRKVDAQGIISSYPNFSADAVAVGPDNKIRIFGSHTVGLVNDDGTVTRIAGRYDATGYAGDNGPALDAVFSNDPWRDMTVDSKGNIYVSDPSNNRVRKIDTNGIITTAVGGGAGGNGGPGTTAKIFYPLGIAVDSCDNLFVTDDDGSGGQKALSLVREVVYTVPTAQEQNVSLLEGGSSEISLSATLSCGDPGLMTYRIVKGPSHGTLSVISGNKVVYTPNADYSGPDTFTFAAGNATVYGPAASVNVTVTHVNHAPAASDQWVNALLNRPASFSLTGTDPDGDFLSYSVVGAPAHGTLSGTAPNLIYTPNPDFTGFDSLTFKATDGTLDSTVATVTFYTNIPILLVGDATLTPGGTSTPLSITLASNTYDIAGIDLTLRAVGPDGAPALTPSFSLGEGDSDWQIQADPNNPWHIALIHPSGINGPAEMAKLTLQTSLAASAGASYRIEAASASIFNPQGQKTDVTIQTVAGHVTVACSDERGDVNQDGRIGLGDVILSLRMAVEGTTPASDCVRSAADVNGDNSITLGDSILILRNFIMGEPFPGS